MERRKKITSGTVAEPPAKTVKEPDPWGLKGPEKFTARAGDSMTVTFAGAKLSIAPYSIVELDSATYTRVLEPGDDLDEQWDRIYGYLKRRALAEAKMKLSAFAVELAKAKKRASGE